MGADSHARLVIEAQEGSRSAFGILARRHLVPMRTLAARLVGDAVRAEDIVQEAMAKALENLPQLRDPARFGAWLTSIVVNECRRDFRRDSPLTLPLPEGDRSLESEDEAPVDLGGVLAATAQRMLDLPPTQAVAAAWFYFHGASYAAIAGTLQTTEAAVQSALQRARNALRKEKPELISKGDVLMENRQADLKHVIHTPDLRISDLSLGDHRWGDNEVSARLSNLTDQGVFVGLDLRTCVSRASNWQTQWFCELKPRETRGLNETYHIFRVLCPWYAVFRGPGVARIRVTFAGLSREQFRNRAGLLDKRGSAEAQFQDWFEVPVPADAAAAGVPVAPVLPAAGDVTVSHVHTGDATTETRKVVLRCSNHTREPRQVRVHAQTPRFGQGRIETLSGGAEVELAMEYPVRGNAERELWLRVLQLPLNYDDLDVDIEEPGPLFFGQYADEVPTATVTDARFALA